MVGIELEGGVPSCVPGTAIGAGEGAGWLVLSQCSCSQRCHCLLTSLVTAMLSLVHGLFLFDCLSGLTLSRVCVCVVCVREVFIIRLPDENV